ncbi:MAG: Smf protein [candidate division WS6 bacterium 36_33]|uniref:Smf protein n=1 Tax=candidate division WS6 bacterium 36_33 TaxID=1641388 RepID=A0A101GZB3_9BACT|nr:MAG: Smf protein [candidate division WS6 bacterium 36_33]
MQTVSREELPPFLVEAIPKLHSLHFIGNKDLLKRICITFVGTRDITEYGEFVIRELLNKELANYNISIVSGLARGVDAYVHKTCLERGIKTIAIVPGAINSAIPKSNREIFQQIKHKGLILAEYSEGVVLRKEMFVLRNRLLAGISPLTIVIQAGQNSGSLITANLALNYNRELCVVPGDINREVSKGCNSLAKQGAGIITSFEDLKEQLGIINNQLTTKCEHLVQGK